MGRLCSWILVIGVSLAVQPGGAQGVLESPKVKNWAWDQVKRWHFNRKDAQGHSVWPQVGFFQLNSEEQTAALLERLAASPKDRRAALLVLGSRPMEQWGSRALSNPDSRDEAALWLYRHGFKAPGREPYQYLEPSSRLERPWTQGLGLHLEGTSWCFQWLPSPALLPRQDPGAGLPAALATAPTPTVLLRLKQLRPGLERLRTLAGGEDGIVGALATGTRAGFLVRHLGLWLKQTPPGLAPLADREAWVLHYGLGRGFGPAAGTLVFLPGELPTRTTLVLDLLKLNPTTSGPRSRTSTWDDGLGGKVRVAQVRGAGGVLHILAVPGGTWICDREEPLRAVAFPTPFPTLGERQEWGRVAMAAVKPGTDVSLWLLPRLGGGAAFERAVLRRRMLGLDQPTWANPGIAKAAPRTGVLSATLGAGPTEVVLNAILRQDQDRLPTLPELPSRPLSASPEQRQAYAKEAAALAARRANRAGLDGDLKALLGLLDLRGAAFLWRGWTQAPALPPGQAQALAEFQKLRKLDPGKAAQLEQKRRIEAYGGFLEPGMSPGVALALPIQGGKTAQVRDQLKKIWPRLFQGQLQSREYAKGVMVQRVVTAQAFRPTYALVEGTLVLGSDDAAVQDILAGILGQAPTLADAPSNAYGRVALDGERAAKALEVLLLSYLRANHEGRYWWEGEPELTSDEASAEVSSTFGPFLGALRALGRKELEVQLTPAGFEARSR